MAPFCAFTVMWLWSRLRPQWAIGQVHGETGRTAAARAGLQPADLAFRVENLDRTLRRSPWPTRPCSRWGTTSSILPALASASMRATDSGAAREFQPAMDLRRSGGGIRQGQGPVDGQIAAACNDHALAPEGPRRFTR